jgi:hypothetical protein
MLSTTERQVKTLDDLCLKSPSKREKAPKADHQKKPYLFNLPNIKKDQHTKKSKFW